MIPIPHFAPPYVDALGSAIAGIAAAIAGVIAVRVLGSKQRDAAPVAQAGAGSAHKGDDEPAPVERPSAPPASIRLALPPESPQQAEPALGETDPRVATVDEAHEVSRDAADTTDSESAS
jgi:hypothetical protein